MRSIVRFLAGAVAACGLVSGCLSPSTSLKPRLDGGGEATADHLPSAKTAELQFALAEDLVKKGQGAAAILQFEKARQNDPRLSARAARRLGVLYDLVGEPAKSMTEFQAALKEFPKDAELLTDVGYAYYNRGDWAEAEKHLRLALTVDAQCKRARMNLGMTLVQTGKLEQGLAEFEAVVSPAEAQANLGFLLLAQGKRPEARQAYQRALELEPNLRVARTALEKMEQQPASQEP
jgi:tetratricopeptide (TPR) repeat protein